LLTCSCVNDLNCGAHRFSVRKSTPHNNRHEQESIMNKTFAGFTIALTMVASAVALAHPGGMGGHMGGGMHAGQQADSQQHGMRDGHGPRMMRHGGHQGPQAANPLMTPEERAATMEKMRSATTPEERQQIATAMRDEMRKRAAERGTTGPEHRGHRRGSTPSADSSTHAH
jgi:Spy/CpxP family protein refolding chaperone